MYPNARVQPPFVPPGQTRALTVTGAEPGATYQVAVRALDGHGNKSPISSILTHAFAWVRADIATVTTAERLGVSLTALGNFNGDVNLETGLGKDDFAAGNASTSRIEIFKGASSGSPERQTGPAPFVSGGVGPGLAAGNLQGNSVLELLVGFPGGAYAYKVSGDSYESSSYRTYSHPSCTVNNGFVFSGGDANGDGFSEVLFAKDNEACVFASDAAQSLWRIARTEVGSIAAFLGNVNADAASRSDLGFAKGSSFWLYFDVDTATAAPAATLTSSYPVLALSGAGDFDGDGIDEFVVATVRTALRCGAICFEDYYPQVTVYYGNRTNTWAAAFFHELQRRSFSQGTVSNLLYRVGGGDVDDDGLSDLVLLEAYAASAPSWRLTVLYGQPRGAATVRTSTVALCPGDSLCGSGALRTTARRP